MSHLLNTCYKRTTNNCQLQTVADANQITELAVQLAAGAQIDLLLSMLISVDISPHRA